MVIYYKTGDLFTSNTSLAHCVSVDLHMGAGIATIFKKKFNGIETLKQQNPCVGNICVLKKNERYIIYLISKEKYYNLPTINALESCLINMNSFILKNDIKSISMPRIGCGLDKLSWNRVQQLLENVFNTSTIDIYIYSLREKMKKTI